MIFSKLARDLFFFLQKKDIIFIYFGQKINSDKIIDSIGGEETRRDISFL